MAWKKGGLISTAGAPDVFVSDLDLARAAERGDPGARRALVESVFDSVRRTSSYLLGPSHDAEDLAQRALIQLLQSIGTYRGHCSLEYWAKRITVRMTFRELRKVRYREQLMDAHWESNQELPSPHDDAMRQRTRVRLAELLAELPEDQRLAIVMHHLEGFGVAEIAEITDTKKNTVRGRLRAGRKKLRERIGNDPLLGSWRSQTE